MKAKTKMKIIYANARGLRSKIKSVKEITQRANCDIFAFAEKGLKANENTKMKGYKWVRKSRTENKEGGGVGFLIKNNLLKACSINQMDSNIGIASINVKIKYNEQLNVFVYHRKQESRIKKEEAIVEFAELKKIIEKYAAKKAHVL